MTSEVIPLRAGALPDETAALRDAFAESIAVFISKHGRAPTMGCFVLSDAEDLLTGWVGLRDYPRSQLAIAGAMLTRDALK